MFSEDKSIQLRNIVTKDQATTEITESLLSAKKNGQLLLKEFVEERLIIHDDGHTKKKLCDKMMKNKPLTFIKLYEVQKPKISMTLIKADRSFMQRMIISYEAGRNVDLQNILERELLPVPLSLSEMNGKLRTGQKSILMDEICKKVYLTEQYKVTESSTLLRDGQSYVLSLMNPHNSHIRTFREFSNLFVSSVFSSGRPFECIAVLFDRYNNFSIKEGTRTKRKKGKSIRRVIEDNPDVPIPQDRQGFLSNSDNKSDLAKLLSFPLIDNVPDDKCVITSGGFEDATEVRCNRPDVDVNALKAIHEEADTHLLLHCKHTSSQFVVVWSRDTDVFLMLVAHNHIINKNVWVRTGTSKKTKYISINSVVDAWDFQPDVALSLLPFHALTGSDPTSFLAGHSKKSAFKSFLENFKLLSTL